MRNNFYDLVLLNVQYNVFIASFHVWGYNSDTLGRKMNLFCGDIVKGADEDALYSDGGVQFVNGIL